MVRLMGWGNIGLSWTRYARRLPASRCERCHLDFPETEENCPHCWQMSDQALETFLQELEKKKDNITRIVVGLIAALLLYAIVILFVIPAG